MEYQTTDTNKAIVLTLRPGEGIVAEPGAMIFHEDSIEAETKTGGALNAIKRAVSGESIFQVRWFNKGAREASIGLAAKFFSSIKPIHITGSGFIVERGAWLFSEPRVKIDAKINLGLSGIFGGEGLVFQKFTGNGRVFVAASGDLMKIDLSSSESFLVDTGCLVGYSDSVSYKITKAGGIFTSIFGGEGLVLIKLTGPGKVVLQSHPSNVVSQTVGRGQSNLGLTDDSIDLSDGLDAGEVLKIGRKLFE